MYRNTPAASTAVTKNMLSVPTKDKQKRSSQSPAGNKSQNKADAGNSKFKGSAASTAGRPASKLEETKDE